MSFLKNDPHNQQVQQDEAARVAKVSAYQSFISGNQAVIVGVDGVRDSDLIAVAQANGYRGVGALQVGVLVDPVSHEIHGHTSTLDGLVRASVAELR